MAPAWTGPISERRNIRERAAVTQRVVDSIVRNPNATVTIETLQLSLNVPTEAARRIIASLVSSGLLREVQPGLWTRGALLGMPKQGGSISRPSSV